MENLTVIAHRGSNEKYPENSLEAFKQAINEGINYIEMDITITEDNKIILQHDIITENSEDLITNFKYTSQLLLETVLKELPKNINIILDLKDPRINSNLIDEVLLLCLIYKCIDRCIFASFNLFHLMKINNFEKKYNLELNKAYSTANIDIDYFESKIRMYNLTHLILYKFQITPELINNIKSKFNIKIYVYTCNTYNIYNYCLKCKVDGIFSDFPYKFH